MTLGRTSSSMEETFYLQALPDPSVPKPAEEDLPKVTYHFICNRRIIVKFEGYANHLISTFLLWLELADKL